MLRLTSLERIELMCFYPEIVGVQCLYLYGPIPVEMGDRGRGTHRDLIQTVLGGHHHGPLAPQLAQDACYNLDQILRINTHDLAPYARRIAKGTDEVKKGPYAHLLAHRGHRFHGRVVERGKEKSETRLFEATRRHFRGHVNANPQRRQQIRAPAQA